MAFPCLEAQLRARDKARRRVLAATHTGTSRCRASTESLRSDALVVGAWQPAPGVAPLASPPFSPSAPVMWQGRLEAGTYAVIVMTDRPGNEGVVLSKCGRTLSLSLSLSLVLPHFGLDGSLEPVYLLCLQAGD